MAESSKKHVWHFGQSAGLVQVKISSMEDILNLKDLDPKLWIALSCPVNGLEFSEETLSLLDTDKNGRVRIPEILEAVEFIKKYFKKPEVIMSPKDSLELDVLGEEAFSCGYSPVASAKKILDILGKADSAEICLNDLDGSDKIFSPAVYNGDGILPAEAVSDEASAAVVKNIIECTGGSDDISGTKGISRGQSEAFFGDLRAVREWRNNAVENAEQVFFLNLNTDTAAYSYIKVRDKINEFFLRCSLGSYDEVITDELRRKDEAKILACENIDESGLVNLQLALCGAGKSLPLSVGINPAWKSAMAEFAENVVQPILGQGISCLTEAQWRKIEAAFAPYMAWYSVRPENSVSALGFERIDEILASDAESIIAACLDEEEKAPPLANSTMELRKMILLRRDFLELLNNFVSFANLYDFDKSAIFQCGTLFIDGRSCDLCFRVTDPAKHSVMAALSQCFLIYCDCTKQETAEKMQVAALVSGGSRDNIIVGRNGLFFDKAGRAWDATITKIVENPISLREAFFAPYKKLARMIQERAAKIAAEKDAKVNAGLTSAVNDPNATAAAAKDNAAAKRFDVGAIAAISVAFTGIATVVGALLSAFFGLGYWIPLGIIGIMLAISLPSVFISWLKLRERNIAPVLDASGWAVNGNVKINIPLGSTLTQIAVRPRGSKLSVADPYKQKSFPWKLLVFIAVVLAVVVWFGVSVAKNPNGISGVFENARSFGMKFVPKKP